MERDFLSFAGEFSRDILGEPFFEPDGERDFDLDLNVRLGLRDTERDLDFLGDSGDLDRERDDFDGIFGEPECERECDLLDPERDRDLEAARGDGDLETDREFAEEAPLLGFAEFDLDLDLERELDLDLELFLDAEHPLDFSGDGLLDLEYDFAECAGLGDREVFRVLLSTGSSERDLERDLEMLLLQPDFELDLDDLPCSFTDAGEGERLWEGERERERDLE